MSPCACELAVWKIQRLNVIYFNPRWCINYYACVLGRFSHVWLCDPMDCSPPGSSIHGILQARILEWVAMPSSTGSSQSRDCTWDSYVSCIGRRVLYHQRHLEGPLTAMCASHSVVSNSLQPHGLWLAGLLCPRDSPAKNTGVDCHSLF